MATQKEKEEAMKKAMEEEAVRKKAEEERIAAEKEFLERHEKERKLGSSRALSNPVGLPGYSSHSAPSSQLDSESEAESKKRKMISPEDKEKKKTRRKTNETDIDLEDDVFNESDDALKNLSAVLNRMREWWRQPAIMKNVTKPQTEKFAKYMIAFEEGICKAREERVRLETRVEERGMLIDIVRGTVREELEKSRNEQSPRPSTLYADMAARKPPAVPKISGVKGPVLPAPKVVIVRQEGKESEEIKATLKKLVKPGEIGLKVRRLTNIRNGVVVEAETEDGAENLLKNKSLQEAGMKVEKPSKKKPIIMIYDVSADLKEEEIRSDVYTRNLHGSDIDENDFKEEFKIRHQYKDAKSSGRRNHIVVECSVRVRNLLRAKEKIFIEWQACRVKDYVDVARCFKCQRYGHIAKHCNSVKQCCSYCAGEHDYKDCTHKNKKESLCCANCKREGRPNTKHDAASKLCPSYEKAVKRLNEKIDYGL